MTLEPRKAALCAHGFRGDGDAARGESRLPSRVVRTHPAPDVLGGLHLEMGFELFAEIVVLALAGEEAGDARERGAKEVHGMSPSARGARNAAMRSAVRCQSRASRASCFLPAAVSV